MQATGYGPDFGAAPSQMGSSPITAKPAFGNVASSLQDYYYASLTHQSHYTGSTVCSVVDLLNQASM